MKLREKIQIEGIPVVWDTNLEDDDIRALYAIIFDDSEFYESGVKVKGLAISVRLFEKTVPFKDGFCWCFGFSHKLWVTYRTTGDWELWNARQAEIRELEQERAEQKVIEKLLLRTTDQHLRAKTLEALERGGYVEAASHICERYEHTKQIEREFQENFQVKWPGFSYAVFDELLRLLGCFPTTDPAIAFLEKHANHWSRFFSFARGYDTWSRNSKAGLLNEIDSYHFTNRTPADVVFREIDKVFRAAVRQFPNEGILYKRICLFWERKAQFKLAIDYCRSAIERQLRDDTQKGFPLRLQRLINKARKANR